MNTLQGIVFFILGIAAALLAYSAWRHSILRNEF
jgi:hypothetical protein